MSEVVVAAGRQTGRCRLAPHKTVAGQKQLWEARSTTKKLPTPWGWPCGRAQPAFVPAAPAPAWHTPLARPPAWDRGRPATLAPPQTRAASPATPGLEPPPTSHSPAPQLSCTSQGLGLRRCCHRVQPEGPGTWRGPLGRHSPPRGKGAQRPQQPSPSTTSTAPAATVGARRLSGQPAQPTQPHRDGARRPPPAAAASPTPPSAVPARSPAGTYAPTVRTAAPGRPRTASVGEDVEQRESRAVGRNASSGKQHGGFLKE